MHKACAQKGSRTTTVGGGGFIFNLVHTYLRVAKDIAQGGLSPKL